MRDLTIENMADLKKELLADLGHDGVCAIDITGVENADLAGFQFLVALWREAAARDVTLSLTGTFAPEFSARMSRLGLGEEPIETGAQLTEYLARLCN